jgi:hypothetical protein
VIELERHIEILLLSNDCVIVPKFGGFMAHRIDASYDDGDNMFIPPLRTLGFNPQLTMNDSLLAQSYVEAYDISYPEAISRIDDEVRELKQHLENEGEYILNDIGVIRLNNDGNYEFEPCEAGILTPELYGLSSFELAKLRNIAHEEEVPRIEVKTNQLAEPQVPIEVESTPEIHSVLEEQDDSDTDDSDKTISISVNLLRNIAVACIAIVAFLLIPSPLGNKSGASISKTSIDTGLLYRIMPKEITSGKANLNITNKNKDIEANNTSNAKNATNVNNNDSINKYNNNQKSIFYSIVLASRVTKTNASLYVNVLHKKGYDMALVLPRKKGAKVIYGKYDTERDAYNALNGLHAKKEFADAWIMHVNTENQ